MAMLSSIPPTQSSLCLELSVMPVHDRQEPELRMCSGRVE